MNNQFNNQNFENVTSLPPIVNRQTNVVHRYFLIEQPVICEQETKFCNHYVKRHTYCNKPICCEENDYVEENCGCCNNQNMNQQSNNNNSFFGGFFI